MQNIKRVSLLLLLSIALIAAKAPEESIGHGTPAWLKSVTSVDTNDVHLYIEQRRESDSEMVDKIVDIFDETSVDTIKSLGELRAEDSLLYHYFLHRNADRAKRVWKNEAKERAKEVNTKEYKQFLNDERRNVINNALALEEYNNTSLQDRQKLHDYESTEEYFIENKEILDQVRGKYVISPHDDNFIIFHALSDSTIAEGKYVGTRPSLNWQFSFKFPMFVWRKYETGIYFDFTNTGCFDLTNGEESHPVSKKSFKPGAFIRFDFEMIKGIRKRNIDNDLDIGLFHHSNGGYDEHDVSRSIMYQVYLKNRFKAFRHKPDPTLYSVYSNHYFLMVDLKVESYGGVAETNKDIRKLWGPARAKVMFEKALDFNKKNEFQMLLWNDWTFARSSQSVSLSLMPVSMRLKKKKPVRIPLAWYVKLYQGRDEYLLYYDQWDRWIGGGFILRK